MTGVQTCALPIFQDINASTAICMSRIRDLLKYSKMVPHVKKVEIYEEIKFSNVCICMCIFFTAGGYLEA